MRSRLVEGVHEVVDQEVNDSGSSRGRSIIVRKFVMSLVEELNKFIFEG
jgi:hypothetical protein